MKTSTIGLIVVVLVIVVGGAWYFMRNAPVPATPPPSTASTEENTPTAVVPVSNAPMTATVAYSGGSFSPESVTIAKGGTVSFINQGSARMWVAADVHPSHENYDGTTRSTHCTAGYSGPKPFDQCAAGSSYSFTFDKAGTWNYHNHAEASAIGVVIVQ